MNNNIQREHRLQQKAIQQALTVPQYRYSPVFVATAALCNGRTMPGPGGMGARVRFAEKAR